MTNETEIPDDVVERLWRDLCEQPDRTSPADYPDMALITLDELRAAITEAVKAERKECAKLCEELRHPDWSCETEGWSAGTLACAAAIRAKGEEQP